MNDTLATAPRRYALSFIAGGLLTREAVLLAPVYVEHRDWKQESPEKAQRQLENLFQIKQSAATLGIVLDVEFVEPHAIHDRSITTDTGWKILLGRGLDIFQRTTDSPFDLATKYQKHRELKGFGITYLRDAAPRAASGQSS